MTRRKMTCVDCGWHGTDYLVAPNPFHEGWTIEGCPACFEVATLRACCDEPGCDKEVVMGTPTPKGYRTTCAKHAPKEESKS